MGISGASAGQEGDELEIARINKSLKKLAGVRKEIQL